jgi:sialate O-acetylesterase
MIQPLVPFALRGVLWYQGEQNIGEGMRYFEKMKALIQGWRGAWSKSELPFYYVQLAPYRYGGHRPTEKPMLRPDPHRLPELWEAQAAALSLPDTGMAVISDLADLDNIAPSRKKEVGERLALWALAETYGRKETVFSGPLFRSMAPEGNRIRIFFDHAKSGLASRNGAPLDGFEVAGPDGKFFEARAEIKGEAIVVGSKHVENPKAVRFGWHQEAQPNLINGAGLPASPFRCSLEHD